MPIYEYKCPKCEGIVTRFVQTDKKQICSVCDIEMEKLMSVPAKPVIK